MHVQVRDGHLGVNAHVDDETVATLAYSLQLDDPLGELDEFVHDARMGRRDVVGAGDVLTRDHQNVDGSLGGYVVERTRTLTLSHHLRRDVPRHNFTKKTITHVVLSSLLITLPVERECPITRAEREQGAGDDARRLGPQDGGTEGEATVSARPLVR